MKRPRISVLIGAALLAVSSVHLLAARGDLYVSNLANNTVDVYAADGTKSVFATDLSSPQGLDFDREHNLYVADAVTGEIYKYEMTGERTTFYSGLSGPGDLTIDHRGNLFVAETGTGHAILIPLDQGPPKDFAWGSPDYPVLGRVESR
jgi:DNA-binding beta-propeller fold protein YncE